MKGSANRSLGLRSAEQPRMRSVVRAPNRIVDRDRALGAKVASRRAVLAKKMEASSQRAAPIHQGAPATLEED